jgi:hypothetical protein
VRAGAITPARKWHLDSDSELGDGASASSGTPVTVTAAPL